MTQDEIQPGQKLWWRHTRRGLTSYRAARVIKKTPARVVVLVRLFGATARRCIKAERLSTKLHGPQ